MIFRWIQPRKTHSQRRATYLTSTFTLDKVWFSLQDTKTVMTFSEVIPIDSFVPFPARLPDYRLLFHCPLGRRIIMFSRVLQR